MFERFTDGAHRVVVVAQAEARDVGQRRIGTEHLLLGLLDDGDGLAAQALGQAQVAADRVRAELLRQIQPGERRSEGQIPFTPRAKKMLELGLRESLRLGHARVGAEHLSLGLTDLREGQAVEIFSAHEVRPEAIRAALGELMQIDIRHQALDRAGAHPGSARGRLRSFAVRHGFTPRAR